MLSCINLRHGQTLAKDWWLSAMLVIYTIHSIHEIRGRLHERIRCRHIWPGKPTSSFRARDRMQPSVSGYFSQSSSLVLYPSCKYDPRSRDTAPFEGRTEKHGDGSVHHRGFSLPRHLRCRSLLFRKSCRVKQTDWVGLGRDDDLMLACLVLLLTETILAHNVH
uniref:Uncharacterized protein n=1 Tax=Bionectria ochroleuca TaxID=29856 RepID=A0A8H7K7S7_BIOOC